MQHIYFSPRFTSSVLFDPISGEIQSSPTKGHTDSQVRATHLTFKDDKTEPHLQFQLSKPTTLQRFKLKYHSFFLRAKYRNWITLYKYPGWHKTLNVIFNLRYSLWNKMEGMEKRNFRTIKKLKLKVFPRCIPQIQNRN